LYQKNDGKKFPEVVKVGSLIYKPAK